MPSTRQEFSVRTLPWLKLIPELGVIFLGVTLSLLADDWRQSRLDRTYERIALQELVEDLQADSVDLRALRRNASADDAAAMWLHHRLRQSEIEQDVLEEKIGTIYNAYIYKAPRATHEGLRSTGRLALIRDPELRRGITDYYEERQPYILQFYESYRELWMDFSESMAWDVDLVYDEGAESFGERERSRMRLKRPWSEVPTDPQFGYRLEMIGILASVIASRSGDVISDNADLPRSIRETLSGS